MRQITTLAIIEKNDEVLLAMKKRGFGEGWWNGYGGKVNEDETIEEAMVRELEEESGLRARKFGKRAIIEFIFQGQDFEVEMHTFEVTEYDGEPEESEEMVPKWFSKDNLPWDKMWPSDRTWLPMFFEGKSFDGRVIFDGETKTVIESEFIER